MSALLDHIQTQQEMAIQLVGIIEAIELLHDMEVGHNARYELIRIAKTMAKEISFKLDEVELPEGGEA